MRKLWRPGLPGLARGGRHRRAARCSTCCAESGRAHGLRDRLGGRPPPRDRRRPADPQRHRPRRPRRRRRGQRPRALRLRRAARRGPGGAARRRDRGAPAATRPSRCPTARGRARARSSPPSRPPPASHARVGRQARGPALPAPRSTASGAGRALVIGDRLDADVAGARAAGLDGAIVLTGATSRGRPARPTPPRRSSPRRWPSWCSHRERSAPTTSTPRARAIAGCSTAGRARGRAPRGDRARQAADGRGRPVAPISKVRRSPAGCRSRSTPRARWSTPT